MELLPQTGADIFLAQGTADLAVPVASFDVLCAHLLAKGKTPNCLRLDGVDHSFMGTDSYDRWSDVWGEIIDWFLSE